MKENRKRFRNRTHPTEQNYFDRLPTELIVLIFERITDAKSLCICYSVCKHFATHVVQTRFVSVEIPCAVGDQVPIWPPGVINFLKKLCCVESAAIQFCPRTNPDPSTNQPLVWWKSDSCGIVFVFAESHGIASVKVTRKFMRGAWFSSIRSSLLDFRLRFKYVKELLVLIPNLKHISADSMKQGSIVVEEQGIACMKNKKNPWDGGGEWCTKLWIARKVKLPFSGCVMRNVVLICDGPTAESLWETNHEYREVAMTMMKKPAHYHIRIQWTQIGSTVADLLYLTLTIRSLLGD